MAYDLAYTAPTDANGSYFTGAVLPGDGKLRALEGSVLTAITGSPTSASAIRLVVDVKVDQANTSYSPATGNTNAGSDTSITFTSAVNHFALQNNSGANVYYNLDAAASTATFVCPPSGFVAWDWKVTVLHLYTAAATPINAANGIILLGRP